MAPPEADEAALVTLPLVIRDSLVGALLFTFRRARIFLDEELSVLETLAGRCAGAIERARLFEEQRTASLTLQRRLLPEIPATPGWLTVGATYEPTTGGEVGGDWYQVMVLDDGRAVAALGDAVGRGIAAAAAMGQLRAAIAGATAVDPTPSTVLAATNQVASVGADTRCASLAYALLDPTHGTITYTIAGHPPPLLLHSDGNATVLNDARGPLLGTVPDIAYESATVDYRLGDTLILYSDGLVERRGESIDEGVARLALEGRAQQHLPPSEMSDALVAALVADVSVSDDVAVLIVRREDSRGSNEEVS
jgi:serine phosphatase RsbU (regulator of sigma subunit)